jgi:hypothetical protein
MSMTRHFIAMAFAYVALTPALTIGSAWDLQAHPRSNVGVRLHGRELHGSLTRDWSGHWVLTEDDGAEYRFHDFDSMSFQMPRVPSSPWRSWRAMVPFFSVAVVALAIAFGRSGSPHRSLRRNSSIRRGAA